MSAVPTSIDFVLLTWSKLQVDSYRTGRSSRCASDYIAETDYALGESGTDDLSLTQPQLFIMLTH